MKQLASPSDIKQLGTILSVWAHPDDESFTAAGIMAAAIANGQKVACITATKGEKGVQDESRWPAARLGEIRAAEMQACLKIIGCNHHHWLGYPDGGCKDVDPNEAVSKLKQLINQYKPDSILTFGPDGMTGHDDHRTVSSWIKEAVKGTEIVVYHAVQPREEYEKFREADEKFNIFFNIDEPPFADPTDCAIYLHLPKDLMSKKYKCLCAQPSQTEAMFKHFGEDAICAMIGTEAFVVAETR